MSFLLLGFVKILDNIILTAKSISTYKGQKILSSILVVISQLIFYLVINQVINDNTMMAIVIVSVSSGIGNYLAFIINEKLKKDDVWQNIITSSNKEFLIELCTVLKEHRIKYLLYDTYNRKFEQSYTVTAFTKTKAESKIIDEYLKNTQVNYLRMIDGIEIKRRIQNDHFTQAQILYDVTPSHSDSSHKPLCKINGNCRADFNGYLRVRAGSYDGAGNHN